MSKLKKVILSALLLSLFIIFNRFLSIKTPILIISLSFIPIMMAAIWLGPVYSTIIAALGDFLAAILWPMGPYFVGFTISYALVGLIYGLFLYNKGKALSTVKLIVLLIISSIIARIGIELFVTAKWIQILYNKAYSAVLASRIIAQLVMIPIQIITIFAIEKFSRPLFEKYMLTEEGDSDE